MTCVIENLNEIKNLDYIKLNETINLNEHFLDELIDFEIEQSDSLPPIIVGPKIILYKSDSNFQDKYLENAFNEEHEEMFGRCVQSATHTYEIWEMFMKYFLNLEYVKEYDESTYHLHITPETSYLDVD